jgi:hypothetical protein
MATQLILNKKYLIPLNGRDVLVLAVDGEEKFNQPGISHGFVHLAHPKTEELLDFCGVTWFEENAVPYIGAQ